jgi:hypothetical protein
VESNCWRKPAPRWTGPRPWPPRGRACDPQPERPEVASGLQGRAGLPRLRDADAGAAGSQRRSRQIAGPADEAARMDTPDMSHTRRTPIARQATLRVSPRAIALFEQLERARRQHRAATCIVGDSPAGYCSSECAACRTWYDLHNKLHEELGLKPWKWLCVPRNPFPPGRAASPKRKRPQGEKTGGRSSSSKPHRRTPRSFPSMLPIPKTPISLSDRQLTFRDASGCTAAAS